MPKTFFDTSGFTDEYVESFDSNKERARSEQQQYHLSSNAKT